MPATSSSSGASPKSGASTPSRTSLRRRCAQTIEIRPRRPAAAGRRRRIRRDRRRRWRRAAAPTSRTLRASGPATSWVSDSGITPARLESPPTDEARPGCCATPESGSSRTCRCRARPAAKLAAIGGARTAARAAGIARRIVRVAGLPAERAHRDDAGRQLVQVRLADDDRARRSQPRHLKRVALPAGASASAIDDPVVGMSEVSKLSLTTIGMPCSGPRTFPAARSRSSASAVGERRRIQCDERVDARTLLVVRIDAREIALDELA